MLFNHGATEIVMVGYIMRNTMRMEHLVMPTDRGYDKDKEQIKKEKESEK
jgi:hypothetical protein